MEPTISILRSTYTSDVDHNESLKDNDGSSPTTYTGRTTHGIIHIVDSTSTKPTMHMWIGYTQLWPMATKHFRPKGYDTFLFTPYSSSENWSKINPELKIVANIVPKGQSATNKPSATKISNDGESTSIFEDVTGFIFDGSYLSTAIKLVMFAFLVCVTAGLGICLGYRYEKYAAEKLKLSMRGGAQCIDTGLFGGDQQQCTLAANTELGLREKTALLFGEKKKSDEEHAQALISWLKEEGGYFHPKLEMRRVDPSDPTSFFGMFANDFIPKDELLIRLPQTMVLGDPEEGGPDVMNCGTVRNLIDQLKLKDDSKYAPYVNYLIDTQPPGCPSAWSEAGKALFTRVTSPSAPFKWVNDWIPPTYSRDAKDFLYRVTGETDHVIDLQQFSPFPHIDTWHQDCKGSNDPLEEYAALIVIQRSWDDVLLPVFDTMSHGNGHVLNTKHNDVHNKDTDIEVNAKRDIEANEQIYTSYNMCESCGNRVYEYGVDSILREYGFVEQMPQSFYFQEMQFGYRLAENLKESGKDKGYGQARVTDWVYKKPDSENVKTMKQMVEQIKKTKATELNVNYGNVNDSEWEIINNYINALENGLKAAIRAAKNRSSTVQSDIAIYPSDQKKIKVIGTEELSEEYDDDIDDDSGGNDSGDEMCSL